MKKPSFNITLTPAAKAMIQAIANAEGTSPSGMIERLIRAEARRRKLPKPSKEEREET